MRWWWVGGAFLLGGATAALAQSSADLYNQAVNAGTAYRSTYSAYVQAKNQHQQYGTGATRLVALEKTNTVLVKRNAWMVAYLQLLRQTLAEVTNVASYPQTVVYLNLEDQINALAALTDLGGGNSFAQLNASALEWEKRLEQLDKLVGAAQLQIASTRLANFQSQLAGLVGQFHQDVATPSSAQATTLALIENKLAVSASDREGVDRGLATYRSGNWNKNTHLRKLDQSQSSLLEAARLLLELSGGRQP